MKTTHFYLPGRNLYLKRKQTNLQCSIYIFSFYAALGKPIGVHVHPATKTIGIRKTFRLLFSLLTLSESHTDVV